MNSRFLNYVHVYMEGLFKIQKPEAAACILDLNLNIYAPFPVIRQYFRLNYMQYDLH